MIPNHTPTRFTNSHRGGWGVGGGISLLVGSVGIFTVMTIGVRERTGEIGLLRAIGATRSRILFFFCSKALCWQPWAAWPGCWAA